MPGSVFLTGERISLRTIEKEDLEFFQEAMNDSQIRRPLGSSDPQNLEQSREFFEEQVCADEGIHLLMMTENELIGFTGLVSMSKASGVAEVGYWIMPDYWGVAMQQKQPNCS